MDVFIFGKRFFRAQFSVEVDFNDNFGGYIYVFLCYLFRCQDTFFENGNIIGESIVFLLTSKGSILISN